MGKNKLTPENREAFTSLWKQLLERNSVKFGRNGARNGRETVSEYVAMARGKQPWETDRTDNSLASRIAAGKQNISTEMALKLTYVTAVSGEDDDIVNEILSLSGIKEEAERIVKEQELIGNRRRHKILEWLSRLEI